MLIKLKIKNILKNKFLYLFFLMLFYITPISVSAQEAGSPIALDSTGGGAGLVALIMGFIILITSIAGVVFIFQGILKLVNNAKNPNDPKNGFKSIIMTFIAGALLTNIYGTSSMVISTVTGSDGFCFNQNQNMTGTIRLPRGNSSECFDAENSDITNSLRDSLTTEGTEAWDEFKDRMEIFLGVIQVIGMYYFVKSIFLLKSSADGKNDAGYGKILIMMLFSSIAMDLDRAITIIINTITSLRG